MEEVKEKAKVVNINTTGKKDAVNKKPSYEELNNYCMQLYEQNVQLVQKLRQADMENLFKRLDYLFKIIEFKDSFSKEFVKSCTDEIVQGMTPQEAPEVTKDNKAEEVKPKK